MVLSWLSTHQATIVEPARITIGVRWIVNLCGDRPWACVVNQHYNVCWQTLLIFFCTEVHSLVNAQGEKLLIFIIIKSFINGENIEFCDRNQWVLSWSYFISHLLGSLLYTPLDETLIDFYTGWFYGKIMYITIMLTSPIPWLRQTNTTITLWCYRNLPFVVPKMFVW